MINEHFFTIKQIIINKRLRQDIKSLLSAKKCYSVFAWELLDELNIIEFIKTPKTLNEIKIKSQIKDVNFLEQILDYLVGEGLIDFNKNKYKYLKKPKSPEKELNYLSKTCPGSTEWTHWLRKEAKKTLLTGEKIKESGFDEIKGIKLWSQVMNESPYALRQITIDQIKDKLSYNKKIVDVGCGDGIGLEDILLKTEKPINLTGIEVSKKYLNRAKIRINKLKKELIGTKKNNAIKTRFKIHDFTKNNFNEKFDAAVLSLVVNHIPEENRKKFFKNIKNSMKDDGKLVTFQFLNDNKFKRSPMWIMQTIPSHVDFPYRHEYIHLLKSIFPKVTVLFNGLIIVCELTK